MNLEQYQPLSEEKRQVWVDSITNVDRIAELLQMFDRIFYPTMELLLVSDPDNAEYKASKEALDDVVERLTIRLAELTV